MTSPGTAAIAKIERRIVVEQASDLVPDECWLFMGARTGPRSKGGRGGYGQVKVPGDPVLEPITHAENIKRHFTRRAA